MPLAELTTPATPFESFNSMVRRMAVKIASHHDISVADTVAVSGAQGSPCSSSASHGPE
jgi:hypothetical protein